VITGSNSGIGLDTAVAFARGGWKVYAGMRDVNKKGELVERVRKEGVEENVKVVEINVSLKESVEKAFGGILKEGPVDVLINNAGILVSGPVEILSEEDINEVLNTNTLGAIRTVQQVLPSMRTRGSGTIVNVSSPLGTFTFPGLALYSASKAALESFTQALHQELKEFGIRAIVLQPGSTVSSLGSNGSMGARVLEGNPYQKQLEKGAQLRKYIASQAVPAADVADLILGVVEKPDSNFRYRLPKDDRLVASVLVDPNGLNLPATPIGKA